MACFIVPATEAIVTSVVAHKVRKTQSAQEAAHPENTAPSAGISWKTKLSWLNTMLWGGTILLALEHVWHGEVVFYPPFLTAVESTAGTGVMLREMATVGVGMSVLVTGVWLAMVFVAERFPFVRRRLVSEEK
ncbi:MAG: hypothetical protein LBU41_03980 [Clostridiales Family XIII bacterium]|jgi:hypothetical protein|nr:hypothetical protein [Clostridiales Family XIII bacterium]